MFNCQVTSLATITFLVQTFGVAIVVWYRLRSQASVTNLAGLMTGILVMAASAIACLAVDRSWGTIQGVAVVAVAIGATIGRMDSETAAW